MKDDQETSSRITSLVTGLAEADTDRRARADELFQEVYADFRRLARGLMSRERSGHTLEPTGLVHEAYMKLVDQSRVDWRGKSHFFAVGARAMRRLLVDHARQKGARKRAGDRQRVTLSESFKPTDPSLSFEELLSLDSALDKLSELDQREAEVVVLRFFGGLTMEEIAEALGVSKRTVEGDWHHARAWLQRELSSPTPEVES